MNNVVLIKINQSYNKEMTKEELYSVTSKSWKVSLAPTSTKKIQYYCAVFQKKIIEVYKLLDYKADMNPNNKGRFILEGELADEELRQRLIDKDVSQIHKGSGNPIKYTSLETLLDEGKATDEEDIIFISNETQDEILDLLEYKKNIILQGAPGVGKTYIAEHIIKRNYQISNSQILQIQFHQSYS